MPETVPADIAAAIERFADQVRLASTLFANEDGFPSAGHISDARAHLNAAILHHLRAYAEMKAALERIEQGV